MFVVLDWLWRLTHYSFTLTINLTTAALIGTVTALLSTYIIRYYVLARYSRLPPTAISAGSSGQAAADSASVQPLIASDAASVREQQQQRKYLPEDIFASFLSSIKIFQYMEWNVLMEFAKHSQQRKLYPGDLIVPNNPVTSIDGNTGSSKDLYLVMDGVLRVYLSPTDPSINYEQSDDQSLLISEARTGGMISSLFDVLSIYTEEQSSSKGTATGTDVPGLGAASEKDKSDTGTPIEEAVLLHPTSPKHQPPLVQPTHAQRTPTASSHQSIIYARALSESTLLVIPHSAFTRLLTTHPTATSQIIQIILTRFQRVTFLTLYKYLGMSEELLGIERGVNEICCGDHPDEKSGILGEEDLGRLRGMSKMRIHGSSLNKLPNLAADGLHQHSSQESMTKPSTSASFWKLSASASDLSNAYFVSPAPENSAPKNASVKDRLGTMKDAIKDGHKRSHTIDARALRRQSTNTDSQPSQHFRLGSNDLLEDLETVDEANRQLMDKGHATIGTAENANREIRDLVFEAIAKMIGLSVHQTGMHTFSAQATPIAVAQNTKGTKTPIKDLSNVSSPAVVTGASTGVSGSPRSSQISIASSPDGAAGSMTTQTSHTTHTNPSHLSGAHHHHHHFNSHLHSSEIHNDTQILFYPAGSVLAKQGERNGGLFFVIDGMLEVVMKPDDRYSGGSGSGSSGMGDQQQQKGQQVDDTQSDVSGPHPNNTRHHDGVPGERLIMTIKPGGLAGYLSTLTGHPSFVTIRAKKDTFVGYLSKASVDSLVEKHSAVLLTLARRLIFHLSPLVRHIDFALEWIQVNAGKLLYRQTDFPSDSIYIVLNGRLRALQESSTGEIQIHAEFGQGESVGELEVLMDVPRGASVHAIRDTELAILPKMLFNALAMRHPEITFQISRIIATKSANLIKNNSTAGGNSGAKKFNRGPGNLNLKTVALIPASSDVPIMDFTERLKESLSEMGETSILLDSATITAALGRHAFSRIGKLKLLSWLTEQEERVRLVLYVADTGPNSPWTQRCIRQADCILLVALGDTSPAVGDYERILLNTKTTARKELVLLHADRSIQKGLTRTWLQSRTWIHAHHHLQIPMLARHTGYATNKRNKNAFEEFKTQIEKIAGLYVRRQPQSAPKANGPRSDFARLARRLVGKTIGLALGGGGARGIAHIGVMHALEEAGIPVDMVGGVSIGALIGGLYAMREDIYYAYWRAMDFSNRTTSVWRQILDLTYPLTSWFSGNEFNRAVWKCFDEHQIEDCWINYFCLTTSITHSRLEVHTAGYLWRYVRASMSLSGYLPPLCDNGNMLLDGGYLNNLPGDVIRSMGADTVIAIDVSSDETKMESNYGDTLSGWYALFMRWNPFSRSSASHIPSLADIQSRLAYVSCVKQLEDVKNMDRCIYVRPPVGHFGTLEFGRFEEIYAVGKRVGRELVAEWLKKGMFQQVVGGRMADGEGGERPKGHGRRNSI